MVIRYKLFDLYTQKYIQKNPEEFLEEEVGNSLLESILPEEAHDKLSLAKIEMGMDEKMVNNNHPDPENNVLLLNRGSRGLYGPSEYKKLLEPYLDTVRDYPYHRYLSNKNEKLLTQELKIWVIDDESGISGIDSVSSEQAAVILGDSHGKISLDLAEELSETGKTNQLIQHRMIGVDRAFFAKGTFQAGLANTLKKHSLEDNFNLANLDMILPTSAIKGRSKSNLPSGVHTVKVRLANHKQSIVNNYTLRAVAEKLGNDSFAWAIKRQTKEIAKINDTFANSEVLFAEYLKFIEPKFNADGTHFDSNKWEESGRWDYITARRDYESGHYQLLTSNVYSGQMNDFYASRARKAAELEFVKVKGGMIYCSHDLANNEICVPGLKEGEEVAAVRSPIIKLQDIAIVKNRHLPEMYNDAGEEISEAIICSPQTYSSMVNQARSFVVKQTDKLAKAEIDTTYLQQLNPFGWEEYQNISLKDLEGFERQKFIGVMNAWREEYNSLIDVNQLQASHLEQIRLDTFTTILSADFDGDNIAIVPSSRYPELVAGIKERIAESDSITIKLDKLEADGQENLAEILTRKSDAYILGKTANLAEQLQSLAIEAKRIQTEADLEKKEAYLTKIAPTFYYLLAQPTSQEYIEAKELEVIATYRDYFLLSIEETLINPQLVRQFDAFALDKDLSRLLNGNSISEVQVDRALALWRDTLLVINEKIALINQIAVDSFKSERPVDKDLVEGLTSRFKYLNDGLKKALGNREAYRTQIPEVNNSTTNRALLVENANQNLTPFQLTSTPYSRITGLFPSLEATQENVEVIHRTKSTINEYKHYRKLSRIYRDKERNDTGSSMVFSHNNRFFEVSNLLSYENSPQAIRRRLERTGEALELKVQPNKKAKAAHQFVVTYKAGDKWKVLGTLCNACQKRYDLKEQDLGKIEKFDFVTPSGAYLAKVYKQEQDKLVTNFLKSVPQGKTDLYAAAAYQILTNSKSDRNNLDFIFAAFGQQIADRVQNYQFKDLYLHSLTDIKSPKGQTSVVINRDDIAEEKYAVYLLGEQGEQAKLGVLADDSFHPRLGATAKAQINYQSSSRAQFVITDGLTFAAGEMDRLEAAGEAFLGEELELEIAPGKPKQMPIFKLDGQTLGIIQKDSAAKLQLDGQLEEGAEIILNLSSDGMGKGKKIKGTTLNGTDSFEITQSYFYAPKALKNHVFKNEEIKLTVGFKEKKAEQGIYVFRQGKRELIAQFNYRYKEDLKSLEEAGLVGQRFKAKVNSEFKSIKLELDPVTLIYPEEAINLFRLQTEEKLSQENNPTTAYFLENSQSYGSIVHYQYRDWLNQAGEVVNLDSLDVLLDAKSNLLLQREEYLKELGFEKLSASNSSLETRKGFVVYTIVAERIQPQQVHILGEELNVRHIFDESIAEDAGFKFKRLLTKDFRNQTSDLDGELLLNQFGQLEQMSTLSAIELPQLAFVPKVNQVSLFGAKLLEVLKTYSLLEEIELQQLIKEFDRFDFQWLNSELDQPVKTVEEVIQVLATQNLASLQELVADFITSEGELIYLYYKNGTHKDYQEQLKGLIGENKYALYATDAQRMLSGNIVPIVVVDNVSRLVGEIATERPDGYSVPLPESQKKGIAPGILLGNSDNELSLALNHPDDQKNVDTNYPLTFNNKEYLSIQAAYQANKSKISFKERYQYIKDLLAAKLTQYPQLLEQITQKGGEAWLYENSFDNNNEYMSGKGKDSGWIRATVFAYKKAIESQSVEIETTVEAAKSTQVKLKLESDGVYEGNNISSNNNQDALSAALANPTENAKYKGNIAQSYSLNFRENPFRAASWSGKAEKYRTEKPQGQPFVSAEDAYQYFKQELNNNQKYELMVEILEAKLTQYPQLAKGISSRGGDKWLFKCDHLVYGKDQFWSGNGLDSGFIKALSEAYQKVIERNSSLIVPVKIPKKEQLSTASQSAQALPIKGKPMKMDFPLFLYDQENPLPVDNCFDAMRGYGRKHTTRNFQPYKVYGFKEGDLAIAFKGDKENPTGKILLRVGKQVQFNQQMLNDSVFQGKWGNLEKHASEALPKLFNQKLKEGKEVWGLHFEPIGDLIDGKVHDFATGQEIDISSDSGVQEIVDKDLAIVKQQQDVVEALDESKIVDSIQHLGTLDKATQASILNHLEGMKSQLNKDVSQYAQGRLNFWLGTQWNLKDKAFESSGTWNSQLWDLAKRIYPDADIALITYSGDQAGTGINVHRDDSYAAFEARSVSLETLPGQETAWQIKQAYPAMGWVKEQNKDAKPVDFSLPSGSMIRFNCKNPHAANPGARRWSINLWKISNKQREAFNAHLAEHGMAGGAKDWGVDMGNIPLPEPINITSQTKLIAPPLADKQRNNIDLLSNPLGSIKPKNDQVAYHMQKDLAMANIATQFIGIPVISNGESSTEKYCQAWGDRANTGSYTKEDVVMVSGNGPWRGVTQPEIESTFTRDYLPLLNKAIAAGAKFVVGSAKGTDLLVQQYLKDKGYQLSDSGQNFVEAQISRQLDNVPQVSMLSLPITQELYQSINSAIKSMIKPEFRQLRTEVEALADESFSVFDTVKFWNKDGEKIINSLTVDFSHVLNDDNLRYQAAKLGIATKQEAVMTFRSESDGKDALYFFSLPNHIKADEIKIRLKKDLAVNNFTLIPTKEYSKVVLTDRGGKLLNQALKFGDNYGIKPRVTQGTVGIIREREFSSIVQRRKESRINTSRSRSNGLDNNGTARGITHDNSASNSGSRGRNLATTITKIKSPLEKHKVLALKAVPLMRSILKNSPNLSYKDSKVEINYLPKTKTLECNCKVTGEKLAAVSHNGKEWISDLEFLSSFTVRDLAYLEQIESYLSNTSTQGQTQPTINELFANHVRETELDSAYVSAEVER